MEDDGSSPIAHQSIPSARKEKGRMLQQIDQWDKKKIEEIYFQFEGSAVRKWAKWISYTGDPRLWGLVFLITGISGLITLDLDNFVIFMASFFQSFLIYYVIKRSVKRQRPFVQIPNIKRLDKTGHGYSFPSGHCHHSAIMILTFWFAFMPPWFGFIVVVYNVLIAYSRLISGCHFPSDTIFGTLEAYGEMVIFWFITKPLYLQLAHWLIRAVMG